MDKRDLSEVFRERLKALVQRSGLNQSAFATSVGIDRSALSQLLSGATIRLPRAETLLTIASAHKVSLDWLLGLSQDEGVTGEIRESLEIEEASGGFERTLIAKWHAEAAGTKIRYVPAGIPDLLRTETLIDYEAGISNKSRESQAGETQYRIDYNRRPETDMEVCMPRHTLEIFARGLGVWSGFPDKDRKQQLRHMADLLDDLYPTFRLFLYDGRMRYSVPYTIFGHSRAAIYVGDMYLVLYATDPIRTLTRHFDNLIRAADINAHETAAFARRLAVASFPASWG
ncbi:MULTISPECIES: helix-turn-helix domain-containing protein [Aminobacter]|jgi:transcriptional regulator with XRE-family HTH domain|uniref:helix-turn-helix domain-containing protein n=1 Tax=Aminobacter TaxID=31988 RepID=UPI00177FF4C8|nr:MULTISPECIES: helix-turn-helix transcriptional regulator [Aminobacter]MDR7220247.1 transcriptional regulator with XRE-family HTH domain [Aminobacter aminovorans]QOF71169.1 helix-turn-helix transcriptional regulator [Aminobacter sp. SR38]